MIADINKYVAFLTENHINEHQFLILWLVANKDEENIKLYKKTFGNFNVNDILYLIDQGWIDDFGIIKDNQITFNIYDFLVNDKFLKRIVVDEEDAYQELCSIYPKWIDIKGQRYASITGDPYKLAKEYHKYIKGNRLAHERVLAITSRWYKDKQFAQVKIENFILNRHWNMMEEEMDKKGVKIDAFKTL